jgi:hypothetical protein
VARPRLLGKLLEGAPGSPERVSNGSLQIFSVRDQHFSVWFYDCSHVLLTFVHLSDVPLTVGDAYDNKRKYARHVS